MRHFRAILLALPLLLPAVAQGKIPDDKIKIGILQDLPEPYAGEAGNGGIVAAQLAASDFEVKALRDDAEILPGTTRDTPDKVVAQVRDWLDKEHVAAVLSSAGPLVNAQIAKMVTERHRTMLVAATDDEETAKLCSPDVVVWAAGPSARARVLAQSVVPHDGKRWFLIADQSPSGLGGQIAMQQAVGAAGGQVVGTMDHVVGAPDIGKALPKIIAAHAQVVALSESDGDLIDAIRSAALVGLSHQTTITAPYARLFDIDQAGPAAANRVVVAAPFYWDTDDATRDFARRWSDRMLGRHVTENAAEIYAATLSFLNAAKVADDVDADKVLPELRHAPLKGTLFGTVTIRADGRAVYDLNVYRVIPPDRIQERWAYYTKIDAIQGDKAFPQTCGAQKREAKTD